MRWISEGVYDYIRTVVKSLWPHGYRDLKNNSIAEAVIHIVLTVGILILFIGMLYLPEILGAKEIIKAKLEPVESISWNIEMNRSILIPESNPYVVIDTVTGSSGASNGSIIVTEDTIFYRSFTGAVKEVNSSFFSDANKNKEGLSSILANIFYVMLPSFAIFMLIVIVMKYLLVAMVFWGLSIILAKAGRYTLSVRELFCVTCYATTIMALIELIAIPLEMTGTLISVPMFFGVGIGIIPLAIYLTLVTLAVIISGGRMNIR